MADEFLKYVEDNPKVQKRYLTLKKTLLPLSDFFKGRRIMDFGASNGSSICVLIELGAGEVIGVEPNEERVRQGQHILEELGYSDKATLHHIENTSRLPFEDGSMEVVTANAVLEHIPEPRLPYIREIWRVLAPGGHLIINETPNKYLPKDFHTTGLFFVPWLPSALARRYAIWRKRFSLDKDWAGSGWRGAGFYEITKGLYTPFEYIPENSRLRHRILSRLGLPASLIDPYPTFIFKKL